MQQTFMFKTHQYTLTEQLVKMCLLHGMMYCIILIEYLSVVGWIILTVT